MARKRGRKVYRPRNGIKIDQNIMFWLPVKRALEAQCPHPALAKTSADPLSDRLVQALTDPVRNAVTAFRSGQAAFDDYWAFIQTLYFLTHAIPYLLRYERIADNDTSDLVRVKYIIVQDTLTSKWFDLCQTIGERHRLHGKYGVSGDDLREMETVIETVEELVGFATVRMVYFAYTQCLSNLSNVEHNIRKAKNL